MPRKNNYLQQLQGRRETTAPRTEPSTKAPSEMTEAELDAEIKRLDGKLRQTKETAVTVGREELSARRGNLSDVLRGRSKKRPWK